MSHVVLWFLMTTCENGIVFKSSVIQDWKVYQIYVIYFVGFDLNNKKRLKKLKLQFFNCNNITAVVTHSASDTLINYQFQ
jgi:hypothetical protein